ncbi:DUF4123 domain-containing protein [Enterobacter sp. CC120223-11]|uniref:DUF4123 domain-containing protein n=1 Tax=Enterobacter sp. CC120223-11 TaxID=1378073 RepID=UPI000BD2DDBE|nr:DUF4123 domain-containing protein [Enterobacter sp. CC120223-11]SNY79310.1 protein of unknown function [Enterobacter sp. CC120223-11]
MDCISLWTDKIRTACQRVEIEHIDVIVDQCAVDFSVLPALSGFSPPILWQSLYLDMPENIYPEDAPVLVRIHLTDAEQILWFQNLAAEMTSSAPLLICGSKWSFERLSHWLRDCANARHEGREGIFRFWDTRIFPFLFSHILDDEQKKQLQQPVIFWSWLDSDNQPVLELGGGETLEPDDSAVQIDLTDSQYEKLMCVSDAKQMMSYEDIPDELFATQQAKFVACYEAMLKATEQRILFVDKREQWAMEYLARQNAAV